MRSRVQSRDPGVFGEGGGARTLCVGDEAKWAVLGHSARGPAAMLLPFAKAALAEIVCKFRMLKFLKNLKSKKITQYTEFIHFSVKVAEFEILTGGLAGPEQK